MLPWCNVGKWRDICIHIHNTVFVFLKKVKDELRNSNKKKNWLPMGKEETVIGIKASFSEYILFYSLTLEPGKYLQQKN